MKYLSNFMTEGPIKIPDNPQRNELGLNLKYTASIQPLSRPSGLETEIYIDF